MTYTLIIKRGSEDPFEESNDPISREQWFKNISSREDFAFDIGLERADYDYAELADDEDESWVHIENNGTLTADNPSPLFIYHLLLLAKDLNALVVGEETEVYQLNEQGFATTYTPYESRIINQWRRVVTEGRIDYVPD